MFALIKREWKDFFLLEMPAFILIAILVIVNCSIAAMLFRSNERVHWESNMYVYTAFCLLCGLPIFSLIFGIVQMCSDTIRKVPTFLISLATTRQQIILAKIISGTVLIIVLTGILVITQLVLTMIYPPLLPVNVWFLAKIYLTTIFTSFALYAVGLQAGCVSNWKLLGWGAILLATPLLALILIKGLGWQTSAILIVFTAATLTKTWTRFMEKPM